MHPSLSNLSPFVDKLLERKAPKDYLLEWQQAILLNKHPEVKHHAPYVFFRLEQEYFAINALHVGEITTLRAIHRLPHMQATFVEGIVNVNGRLLLFVQIEKLLSLQTDQESIRKKETPLILVEKEGFVWAFSVTEVLGMLYIPAEQIKRVPVIAVRSSVKEITGFYQWQEQLVGLLDEELLIARVRRSLKTYKRG